MNYVSMIKKIVCFMVWWICMGLCKNHEFYLDYGIDYEIW